jgi:hypothetical protein
VSDISRHLLPLGTPARALALRAGRLAYCEERAVVVVDADGARPLGADWGVDQCHLAADGRFVAALGDDGRRATVWNAANGERLLNFVGVENRRQSLRIGLATLGEEPLALVAPWNQPISIVRLRDGRERMRLATIALVWFHALGFAELDRDWLAVQGHLDGEQYDSIVTVPRARALSDTDALQAAITESGNIREWGYRIAVGPAEQGRAVFYRDHEWGDDDRPDDPAESFAGFVFWNLAGKEVEQRIAYDGEVTSGAPIGADARRVAVGVHKRVIVVDRATGTTRHVDAVAFDPYRLEILRFEADVAVIEAL